MQMQEKNDSIGHWLLSIPRDDIPSLTQNPEYDAFLKAFQDLECAHRKIINDIGLGVGNMNDIQEGDGVCDGHGDGDNHGGREGSYYFPLNFHSLPRFFDDDMILRIFEFLNCHTLARLSETCNRFWILSNRSAKQRTSQMHGSLYLESSSTYMKLLRAKEQIQGIHPEYSSVRIPLMALGKRIRVTDCGDEELNGTYFCTGTNGNGFLFSKPRFQRCSSSGTGIDDDNDDSNNMNMNVDEQDVGDRGRDDINFGDNHRRRRRRTEDLTSVAGDEIFSENGQDRGPRCIISKRYSEATILWYMSKEVENEVGELNQEYCFWAKLMSMGEVPPEIAKYPSQTSILSRNGDPAWTSLPSTRMVTPPIVELFE